MRSDRYLTLNRSGARLWPLLIAGIPTGGSVDELVESYQLDDATAIADVDRLLASEPLRRESCGH